MSSTWLTEIQRKVHESTQWQLLTRQIFEQVQLSLEKNKIHQFSDLTEEERFIMLNTIESSLANEYTYLNFEKTLAECIDEGLCQAIVSDLKAGKGTRTELLTEYSASGLSQMLQETPIQSSALRVLLNQKIPLVLRFHVWDIYLKDTDERASYLQRLNSNRSSMVANNDAEITDICQEIISKEITSALANVVHLAKTVLSYICAMHGTLDPSYYFICVPLVIVLGKSSESIPKVVEAMYAVIKMPKPRWREDIQVEEFAQQIQIFSTLFKQWNCPLYDHLLTLKSDENISKEMFIFEFTKPFIDQLFVGLLNQDACQYVWDQCILVGFDKLVIPFTICVMICLQEIIIKQSSIALVHQVLKTQSQIVSTEELQKLIEIFHMSSIRETFGITAHQSSHWGNDPTFEKTVDDINSELLNIRLDSETGCSTPVGTVDEVKAKLEQRYNENNPGDKIQSSREESSEESDLELELMVATDVVAVEPQLDIVEPESANKQSSEPEFASIQLIEPESANMKVYEPEIIDLQKVVKEEAVKVESETAQLQLNFPEVIPGLNHFSDTVVRTTYLNPNEDVAEIRKLVAEQFADIFGEQRDFFDVGVCRVKAEGNLLVFRALVSGEPKTVAEDIVKAEIKRQGIQVKEAKITAMVKHVVQFSKTKCGYEEMRQHIETAPIKESVEQKLKDSEVGVSILTSIFKAVKKLQNDPLLK